MSSYGQAISEFAAVNPALKPLSSHSDTTYLSPPKPPYPPQPQLVVHPNNTTDRHHEFTFGVEVETVVAGLPDELDVYDALVETMMKLPESGVLEIESEKWFEYTGSNQDRSKFLIQKDTSIDDRLFNIPLGRCAVSKIEDFGPSSFISGEVGTPAAPVSSYEEELLGDNPQIEQDYCWGHSDCGDTLSTRSTCSANRDDWEHDADWLSAQFEPYENSSSPTSVSGDTDLQALCEGEPLSFPNSPVECSFADNADTNLAAITEKTLRITENGFVSPVIPIEDVTWVRGKAVEICTPIMTSQNYSNILDIMLNHLNTELDIRFNRSTGLHVHIGCGKGMKWSIDDIKAIAKAVVMFERLIDRMHPESRLDQVSWIIRSNRSSSDHIAASSMSDIFGYFDSCKTTEQLVNLMGRDRFVKYNFTANDRYGTVEFRQALGTGNSKEVIDWVDFVAGFVKAALEVTKEEWVEFGKIVGMGSAEETLKLDPEVLNRFGIPIYIRCQWAGTFGMRW